MSNNYWAERMAKAQDKITQKHIEDVEKQLSKYYSTAMKRTIADFEATYDKLLATVADGVEPTPADLYKLDRYWELQAQLKTELEKLGDRQVKLFSDAFEEQFFDIYNSISIPSATAYSTIDKGIAQQMINQIWVADGKNFSQRIWGNTEKLIETLNDELINCVATGRSTEDLKQLLQKRFKVSYSNADSIVKTETAHIQTQAARKRYEDYGIQEVEVWADEDERRCEVCGKLHQKRYPVGANMPIPAHPRCRCAIIPVVEDEEKELLTSAKIDDKIEVLFDDKIDFENNKYVKKAIKSETTNFVAIYEPKNIEEFNEVLYGEYADNIPPYKNYYDVKAHGNPSSIKLYKKPINAVTLAKILEARNDYEAGKPIRLLCCSTGKVINDRCFAQDLANVLGVEVYAPVEDIYCNENGQLMLSRKRSLKNDTFRTFKPQRKN